MLRLVAALAAVPLAGCGGGDAAPVPVACEPACSVGYVCVSGACVSPCNPPCGAGQRCVSTPAGTSCVADDAGVPPDAAPPTDVPSTPMDAPPTDAPAADVPPPEDTTVPADTTPAPVDTAPAPADTGAPPRDAPPADTGVAPADTGAPPIDAPRDTGVAPGDTGAPPADTGVAPADVPRDVPVDAPPPCGSAGQRCCGDPDYPSGCRHGTECVGEYVTVGASRFFRGTTCRTIATRFAGECTYASECTAGLVCAGPMASPGRTHFVCQTPPGTFPYGTSCADHGNCATGLCAFGRCSIPCALGTTGDAECAARSPSAVCVQASYRSDLPGTTNGAVTVALGFCVEGCDHERACPTGFACAPTINSAEDRMRFVCSRTAAARTGVAGSSCDPDPTRPNTCQTSLCIDVATGDSGPRGVCTAPCRIDADCPSTMRCVDIGFVLPSRRTQDFRGCYPR